MPDSLYRWENGEAVPLDIEAGSAPEFAQRIEALEQQNAEQDEAINAAQTAADAAQSSADAVASETVQGRVKLSDSTSSTSSASEGVAASPKAVKDAYDKALEVVPVGSVVAFAGNPDSDPSGYLPCIGAPVSRTTYAALFAVIGTTYGTGNGTSTFNLPNLVNKFIQGSDKAGAVKDAGLPNVYGWASGIFSYQFSGSGALSYSTNITSRGGTAQDNGGAGFNTLRLNASDYNTIYGASATVQPPAVTMRYYIKY